MTNQQIPAGWYLGMTSAIRESHGDAGTISSGAGDNGGISYGTYQLSKDKGTLGRYLDQSAYKKDFESLKPATLAFDIKWRNVAKEPGFGQDQYDFIKRTHYDVQVEALKKDGLDLTARGPAVQDALWSTAVQTGGITKTIFEQGLHEKFGKDYKLDALSDKDIVTAVQDYKIEHNDTLFRHSKANWPGLISRAEGEKADLLSLADGKLPAHIRKHANEFGPAVLRERSKGADVIALQSDLGALGYTDSHGQPLQVDGHFGRDTSKAVERFQKNNCLQGDGVAGAATRVTLNEQRQNLDHARGPYADRAKAVTKDSSTHDMFEAICSAASRGDAKGMLAVGKCFEQSPEGQSYLAMGAQLNQQQAQIQAQNQTINQQATQINAQTQTAQQSAPATSR